VPRREPSTIGAQSADLERQVIALSGDGGIAMLLGELITLRQRHLVELAKTNLRQLDDGGQP
jgi:pyruvate dehydrogenase (quinone)